MSPSSINSIQVPSNIDLLVQYAQNDANWKMPQHVNLDNDSDNMKLAGHSECSLHIEDMFPILGNIPGDESHTPQYWATNHVYPAEVSGDTLPLHLNTGSIDYNPDKEDPLPASLISSMPLTREFSTNILGPSQALNIAREESQSSGGNNSPSPLGVKFPVTLAPGCILLENGLVHGPQVRPGLGQELGRVYSTFQILENGEIGKYLDRYWCLKCDHQDSIRGDMVKHVRNHYPPTFNCRDRGCQCIDQQTLFHHKRAMDRHIKTFKNPGNRKRKRQKDDQNHAQEDRAPNSKRARRRKAA
ncbi:hypothetical protein CVT25_001461 [Psilocybe cyanescens]|uniref:Uncharacterized protein n=1 Tax=Psilocybe cyanescens TaxID=93625 RepID=A0A409WNT4_PSICY|nr:hypothetical protein CVT25_001461 [Psilocybe cyanescens]